MKKLLELLMVLAVALSVTSCNMFKGAGEDIENAGDAVGDAVNDVVD